MSSIDMSRLDIATLNRDYKNLNPIERLQRLFRDYDHDDILVTSSFGTTSGILMSMVSKAAPGHPIHFIDTTFCFKETIEYKEMLTQKLGLNIVHILPNIEDNQKARTESLWSEDPDTCCYLNKVKPFEPFKTKKKIWVSGLLMNQTPFRANLRIFEKRDGIVKMHPNIDTSAAQFDMYLIDNNIPPHPMKQKGFDSVGCSHCTARGKGRSGRWAGIAKNECGIHQ